MKLTYGKEEKLKGKKNIEQLFAEGNSISSYPLRLVYLKKDHMSSFPILAGVSVPKRKVAKAVHRNRIKRLMREAFRLQKQHFYEVIDGSYLFMFLYLDTKEVTLQLMEEKMKKLAAKLKEKIS